jgi:hypothetical protein
VALAFLLLMLTDRQQHRWSAGALGLTLITALIIEVFWQSSFAHLNDLRMALHVSGFLRGTWGQITDHILVNLTDYVLLGLVAGIALWRTRSIRDALFYGFCAVAGFLIVNQNFQAWGIISLHAAAAVAGESILRTGSRRASDPDRNNWSTEAGAKLLFLAFVLPTIVHCALALGLHTVAASTKAGEAVALPRLEQVRIANLWTWNDYDAAIPYLAALRDGADALASLDPKPSRIFVLDVANPFSMALNVAPAKGDTPWLQWDRTLNDKAHIPAEALLSDVQIVMEPKPANDGNAEQGPVSQLQAIYGPYISANFDPAHETDHWKLYRRRHPVPPQAALNGADRS